MFRSKSKNNHKLITSFSINEVSSGQVNMLLSYLKKELNLTTAYAEFRDNRCWLYTDYELTLVQKRWFEDRNAYEIETLAKSMDVHYSDGGMKKMENHNNDEEIELINSNIQRAVKYIYCYIKNCNSSKIIQKKFPIIYMNKEIVYYKTARKSTLDRQLTTNVINTVDGAYDTVTSRIKKILNFRKSEEAYINICSFIELDIDEINDIYNSVYNDIFGSVKQQLLREMKSAYKSYDRLINTLKNKCLKSNMNFDEEMSNIIEEIKQAEESRIKLINSIEKGITCKGTDSVNNTIPNIKEIRINDLSQ